MNILLLLIPLSLVLVLVAVGAFVWAVRRGQFDDLDTPAIDILGDNDAPLPPAESAGRGEPRPGARNGDAG
ncbi:cbb3-type cytochrome oxidase assembly protein CcoS [Luteimonas sp. RD2P54]|uniref:Cbb3-type cytochrome oxidase assembly protein CcoS n=1 Tax=Luteimonas endophytica TaxID=3042023 RepID=A0ABT6J5Z2_9GAMM|nr:cbb3-type cytochrome oxidase assembly protein CcoS [Luteimonas endophytica]MDH5822234.1 cbb3-type cytochrome oxidase assembly protein CcoS [Luteimonas endophytica]